MEFATIAHKGRAAAANSKGGMGTKQKKRKERKNDRKKERRKETFARLDKSLDPQYAFCELIVNPFNLKKQWLTLFFVGLYPRSDYAVPSLALLMMLYTLEVLLPGVMFFVWEISTGLNSAQLKYFLSTYCVHVKGQSTTTYWVRCRSNSQRWAVFSGFSFGISIAIQTATIALGFLGAKPNILTGTASCTHKRSSLWQRIQFADKNTPEHCWDQNESLTSDFQKPGSVVCRSHNVWHTRMQCFLYRVYVVAAALVMIKIPLSHICSSHSVLWSFVERGLWIGSHQNNLC